MEQFLYLSTLFDLYGALLTEKQQECLRLHLFEDFSLSEIGEELGISRQAVYDNIHRSEIARSVRNWQKFTSPSRICGRRTMNAPLRRSLTGWSPLSGAVRRLIN